MKKTVNVEKLTRNDIDTDRLQRSALDLVKELYHRADVDLSKTMENEGTDQSEQKDRVRVSKLRDIYQQLKELPLRGEKWRHRLP